jgi:hypothetical protein
MDLVERALNVFFTPPAGVGAWQHEPRQAMERVLSELHIEDPYPPQAHHRNRIRVRGICVDENSDERGDYVDVELRQDFEAPDET